MPIVNVPNGYQCVIHSIRGAGLPVSVVIVIVILTNWISALEVAIVFNR